MTADARQEVIDAFAPQSSWSDSGQLLDGEIVAMPSCRGIIRDNVSQFPAIGAVIDELLGRPTIERMETLLAQPMDGGFLKLDLARDSQSLRHDVSSATQKALMSMLIAVNPHVPVKPIRLKDRAAVRCETDEFEWGDNVGYMLATAIELPEEMFSAERHWLHVCYIREATDWKLPPRRATRAA